MGVEVGHFGCEALGGADRISSGSGSGSALSAGLSHVAQSGTVSGSQHANTVIEGLSWIRFTAIRD